MRLPIVFVVGALLGLAQAPALDEASRLKLLRGYERRGEWFLAAEQLEALRKLAPKNPEYAYQLGVVYRSIRNGRSRPCGSRLPTQLAFSR